MTITSKFRDEVLSGFYGKSKRPILNALVNFNGIADKAGAATGPKASTKYFADVRTLAASGVDNLDLAGGVTDQAGNTITFTKVHAIYVRASSGNTNKVQVGGHASAAFVGPFAAANDIAQVDADSSLFVSSKAGWDVTATTADILKVANSAGGTPVTYDIVVIGE